MSSTTITSVRLEPVQIHPSEILKSGITQRPALLLHPDTTTEYILGRNITTGINDPWVHRHAATIRLAIPNGTVWIQVKEENVGIHDDGNDDSSSDDDDVVGPTTGNSAHRPPAARRRPPNHNNNHNKRATCSILVNGHPPSTLAQLQEQMQRRLIRRQLTRRRQPPALSTRRGHDCPMPRQRVHFLPSTVIGLVEEEEDQEQQQQQQQQRGMELHHGDIIAIEGRRDPVPLRYTYQVQITKTAVHATAVTETAAAVAAAAKKPAATAKSPRKAAAAATALPNATFDFATAALPSSSSTSLLLESIGNEAMCPICMEIQVQSRSLVPCGHSFCQSCVTSSHRRPSSCPVCRQQPVRSHVPNLVLDNIIWNMIVAQSSQSMTLTSSASFFDDQDIPTYLERSGKKLPVAEAANEPSPSSKTNDRSHLTASQTAPASKNPRRSPRGKPSTILPHTARRKRPRFQHARNDITNTNTNHDVVLGGDVGQGTSVANAICLD